MCTPLVEMSVDDVVSLIKRLKTPPVSLDIIVKKFQSLNLNGLVLASASLNDVRDAMNVTVLNRIINFFRLIWETGQ